jgi:hypothetical protein
MWHVTVTVSGAATSADSVREALERLSLEHPFLLEAKYSGDRAEIRYWEEAEDMETAARAASAMWADNSANAQLPAWEVVALEVLDRSTYLSREPLRMVSRASAGSVGRIVPFA